MSYPVLYPVLYHQPYRYRQPYCSPVPQLCYRRTPRAIQRTIQRTSQGIIRGIILQAICEAFFLFFFFLASACLFSSSAFAWDAYVLRVVDGDTLLVTPKSAKEPETAAVSVRLYGIDAPELNQAGGQEAKAALALLAPQGAEAEIVPMESDRYDRVVGLVLLHGALLNLEQIRHGHARVYEKYCRAGFCRAWKKEEWSARQEK